MFHVKQYRGIKIKNLYISHVYRTILHKKLSFIHMSTAFIPILNDRCKTGHQFIRACAISPDSTRTYCLLSSTIVKKTAKMVAKSAIVSSDRIALRSFNRSFMSSSRAQSFLYFITSDDVCKVKGASSVSRETLYRVVPCTKRRGALFWTLRGILYAAYKISTRCTASARRQEEVVSCETVPAV